MASQLIGGRYEVLRKIAEGGMGEVFEARHHMTRKIVALKVLFPHIGKDENSKARFLREVSAHSQIGHPGIVDVIDSGFDPNDGALFVAMEFLKGDTMREWLERQPRTREEVLDLFEEILAPLAAAHERGIVHRDLKPDNVMLAEQRDGSTMAKILDFGIARDLDTSEQNTTKTGIAMGTPHYMAPEQAMSARGVLASADVWAIGAMMYEAFSGKPPFDGETASAVVVHACTSPHPPMAQVLPDLPAPLAALIDRCLSKTPTERPADGGALHRELRAARGQGVPQTISTPIVRGAGQSTNNASFGSQAALGSHPGSNRVSATNPAGSSSWGTGAAATPAYPPTGAPGYATPPPDAPGYATPPPGYATPPPGAPGYATPAPGYATPSPGPGYATPPPGPGYATPSPGPGYASPAPSYATPGSFGGAPGVSPPGAMVTPPPGGFGMRPASPAPKSNKAVLIGVAAVLVLASVGAVAAVLISRDTPSDPITNPTTEPALAPTSTGMVQIVSDVSGGGELLVDGVSSGPALSGQQVTLPSGEHRLEYRVAGNVVASTSVTVVTGQTVMATLNRANAVQGGIQVGTLAVGDSTLNSGELSDHYTFRWPVGSTVRVEARSTEFDPYLIVKPPTGAQLDNDDMAQGETTAGLDVVVTMPGEWTVIVTSYAPGEAGAYQLVTR